MLILMENGIIFVRSLICIIVKSLVILQGKNANLVYDLCKITLFYTDYAELGITVIEKINLKIN